MDRSGIKQGYVGVLLLYQQGNFRAAFNHGLCALCMHCVNNTEIGLSRVFVDCSKTKLIVNYPVYDFPVTGRRCDDFEPVLLQTTRVEILLHRKAGAEQADALDTAFGNTRCSGVCQMQ